MTTLETILNFLGENCEETWWNAVPMTDENPRGHDGTLMACKIERAQIEELAALLDARKDG